MPSLNLKSLYFHNQKKSGINVSVLLKECGSKQFFPAPVPPLFILYPVYLIKLIESNCCGRK